MAQCQLVGILIELFLQRGLELEAADALDDAKTAYRHVLARAPTHAEALSGLGRVLYRQGSRRAARKLFERVVALHPRDAAAHTNLGILLLEEDQLSDARRHHERALELDPAQSMAHYGLSRIAAIEGDDATALRHQRAALGNVATSTAQATDRHAPTLLLLASRDQLGAVGAQWIAGSALRVVTLLVEDRTDGALPAHHAIFNTITDADRNEDALRAAARIVAGADAPVINAPTAVLETSRLRLAGRLAGIEGAVLPRVASISREQLSRSGASLPAEHDFGMPLLLRSKGFHSGQHFVRVERAASLAAAADALPGDELLAIEYVDARSDDGHFRKYRMMIVDGVLYPLHLAVADEWKVHYFSAGMAANAQRRREDEAFLADPRAAIGDGAMRVLEQIAQRLALDYAGIDFALDARGRVLVFEANATMTVPAPPTGAQWDYRRTHVTRILDATRRMLFKRARAGGWR